MKRVVIVLLILGLMLTGCNQAVAKPLPPGETTLVPKLLPTPISVPAPTETPVTAGLADLVMPPDFYTNENRALGPDTVYIAVTQYELGGTFEWPIYIHNGDGMKAKLLEIETEPEEAIAAIPLTAVLANSGLLDIIAIESNLEGEHLEATAYDASTRLLTIKGFVPASKRLVRIVYKTISTYSVFWTLRAEGEKGYELADNQIEKWFSVDQPTITLRPMETKTVTARLTIPPKSDINVKEVVFWIAAIETVSVKSRITTEVGNKQRVFLSFR